MLLNVIRGGVYGFAPLQGDANYGDFDGCCPASCGPDFDFPFYPGLSKVRTENENFVT